MSEDQAAPKTKAVPRFVILSVDGNTYIEVGRIKAGSGRLALKEYTEKNGVTSGKFIPVAESSFSVIPVSSETVVKIG